MGFEVCARCTGRLRAFEEELGISAACFDARRGMRGVCDAWRRAGIFFCAGVVWFELFSGEGGGWTRVKSGRMDFEMFGLRDLLGERWLFGVLGNRVVLIFVGVKNAGSQRSL